MHRILVAGEPGAHRVSSPDMTVSDAADAMERMHARGLFIGRGGRILGYLSEQEIVAKVLAPGLDPNLVHVGEVMLPGRSDGNGALLVEDELETPPMWGAETLHSHDDDDDRLLLQVLAGACEECGVHSEELCDHEGLLMCADCSGFRSAMFQ